MSAAIAKTRVRHTRHQGRTFPADGLAASSARSLVAETFEGWSLPGLVDDGRVLVSELVTNVHVHAGAPTVEIFIRDLFTCVWIGVWDQSGTLPEKRQVADDEESGRGWTIIEALADSSGVAPDGLRGGKIAWAKLRKDRLVAD